MIAYFFPPVGGSGALRPMKLAKYLPDSGWRPVILTVRNPDWYYASDPELLDELPDSVVIHRSPMLRAAWFYRVLNPFRVKKMDRWVRQWLLHPDPQVGWIPFGLAAGLRLVRKYNIRAIYSTSAPLSSHLIAMRIKEITGIPWIADFRDEWVENPDIPQPTGPHRKLHFQLEKRIVHHADQVITAAPGFRDFLKKHDPLPGKLTTLTMGFDPEDFAQPVPPRLDDRQNRFTIAFTGIYYGSFRPTRFLEAVTRLIVEGKIQPDRIRIVFAGANEPGDSGFQDRFGICVYTGFLSHRKTIEILRGCDALLLLLSRERGDFVIPSKSFEYMAAGKPILAIVPAKSEVADIIGRSGTGVIADFEDMEGIKSSFLKMYQLWEGKKDVPARNACEVEKFNQVGLTAQFAGLLDKVVKG